MENNMNRSFKLLTASLAALVALAGCDNCGGPDPVVSRGEVRLHYKDAEGQAVVGENAEYDFGTVSMGTTGALKLVVQNVGRAAFTIDQFAKVNAEDSAVEVGAFLREENPLFKLAFPEGAEEVEVLASETLEFDMSYLPPVVEDAVQDHQVVLTMHSANTVEGRENATITLKGRAVRGDCDLPDEIDFGAVARGDTARMTFEYTNSREIETSGFLGEIGPEQLVGIFNVSPDSPRNEFLIAGNSSKTATFTFRPTEGGPEGRAYRGTVTMRRATDCPDKTVLLVGTGVDQVLSWTPASLDFGYSAPGDVVTRTVTISNLANQIVTLTPLAINDNGASNPSNIFKIVDTGEGSAGTSIVVPAGTRDGTTLTPGSVTVTLSFKPSVLGRRDAQFRATTPLESQQQLIIPMTGIGGGPKISISPSPTLDLGRIAYFATATVPSAGQRKLTIRNVGTPSAATQGNLKLGSGDITSGYAAPYWEIVPVGSATAEEICVGIFDSATNTCTNGLPESGPNSYQPAFGIQAGSSALRLEIPVRVTPNGLGLKEWDLRVFSNDPDQPVSTIRVRANAVELAPCDVSIAPSPVHFGIVTPPSIKDLAFSIHNNSQTDECLIANLQLGTETGTPAGQPSIFTLPGGEVTEIALAPQATRQIFVRAWPQGTPPQLPSQVTGKVVFNVAHPDMPLREVPLVATVGTSCLTIAPSAVNFGSVKVGCYSQTKVIDIYNSCSNPVTINTTSLAAPAGVPAGVGACPAGGGACSEFFLMGAPANSTVIPAGSVTPVTVSVRYHPYDQGSDSASVMLNVTQGAAPQTVQVDYVVPLNGNGNNDGLNTDTYRQDVKPKADILVVIDDSCSMGFAQTAIAANMDAFLQYALSNQVDFHIAVTNTELNDPGHGKFCATSGSGSSPCTHGNKVLTPESTNLSAEFAELVTVGVHGYDESCLVPATKALTAPYITDPTINGGFLRNDAVLAVVCVTDARENSPQPAIFYLSQLMAIKGAQRANMFTYNVIGPFLPTSPSGCSYDGGNDDGKHAFMVQQTNGVKEEICSSNWSTALERVGKGAFGFRTNFYLTSPPDLSSPAGIVVKIDNMVVGQTDGEGTQVWHYDATTNSVNFQPLFVPEPGQTLTITYEAACFQ
mgnify:CR=1 FL=1